MQDFKTDIDQVRTIAWVLAKAGADHVLDVPGEYVWARPMDGQFDAVRSRSRSVFSSGNSIKDHDVINHIQGLNLAKHLLDPWVVRRFEDQFPNWVMQGTRFKLHNFDQFRYVGFSAGMQESFLNFYLSNKNKRFRVFLGDYWWHMNIWNSININWEYIEDDDLAPGDICICSYPFALIGDKHENFDWLVEECNRKNIELLVDFIYLPNSSNAVDIDLSAECIKQITFSFSKTFPVQSAKIAVRMCKSKPNDPMQISNDENICNRLSAGLALEVINQFPIDYNVDKYYDEQTYWCHKLGLKQTKVVHFGLGTDYTNFGKSGSTAWLSPFNQQHNRYNLGILFENKNLLKKLQLY